MSLRSRLRSLLTFGQGVLRGLPDARADADPIALFGEWFRAAREAGILLPESMMVATATKDGSPSARMMLLKHFDARGFVFYTNFESRKSRELDENPRAALVLHWPVLQRQVRIEGTVARIATEESEEYFRTRPRGARIGAWASRQSAALENRAQLETSVRECEKRFEGGDVPLPPFWGGYRLHPERIEFWQGRLDRLHDRLCFTRAGDGWKTTRLHP